MIIATRFCASATNGDASVCKLESFLASLVIPRARYSRTCSVRLEITGRIERMNQEPQDAAASSQEVLGYENRGKEAKRRENGDDGRENGCGGIHTRKWQLGELWREIKREATAGERERNGMTLTANRLRDIRIVQNLSRSLLAAFVRRIVTIPLRILCFLSFFFPSSWRIYYRRCVHSIRLQSIAGYSFLEKITYDFHHYFFRCVYIKRMHLFLISCSQHNTNHMM